MQVCRGQIAGRQAEGGYHMLCGILEAEIGTFKDEHLYCALAPLSSSSLTFINNPLSPDEQTDKCGYSCTRYSNEETAVGNLLTSAMWSLAQCDGPSLQIYLRKSTAPSENGKEILIFSGILKQDPSEGLLTSEKMHDIALLPDQGLMAISPAKNDHHQAFLECRGCQLNAFLQKPVWGWGETTWGIKSTLSADINHKAHELSILEYRKRGLVEPPLSEEEEARRVELNKDARLCYLCGEKGISRGEHSFEKAVKFIAETYGANQLADYVGVSTAEDLARREAQMKHAIEETYEDLYG